MARCALRYLIGRYLRGSARRYRVIVKPKVNLSISIAKRRNKFVLTILGHLASAK